MSDQICPTCGCDIDEEAYEKEGILYCCEPCSTDCNCECGCIEEECD